MTPQTFTLPLDRQTKPSEAAIPHLGKLKLEVDYDFTANADPRTPGGRLELWTSLDGVTFARHDSAEVATALAGLRPQGRARTLELLHVPGVLAAVAYVPESGGVGWTARVTMSTEFEASREPVR